MKKYSKYLLVLCICLFSCFFVYICFNGINSLFMTNLSGTNYKTTEVTTWNELKNAISDSTCNKVIIKSNLVANSSINITTRCWVKNADYWTVNFQLLKEFKNAFDENHIQIPFNQLDVTITNNK